LIIYEEVNKDGKCNWIRDKSKSTKE
jgi:hypothetical protein